MNGRTCGIVAVALVLGGVARSAQGACLVLKGGASMEVKTAPKAKGAMVVFQDLNGRLASMRGNEVDMAATDAANANGVCGGAFVGTPARDTPRPVAIQAPTEPVVETPKASDILANSPQGAKAGPPSGVSIDCDVVECGKAAPKMKSKAERAAGAAAGETAPESTVAPEEDPGQRTDDATSAAPAQQPRRAAPENHSNENGYGDLVPPPAGSAVNLGGAMTKPPAVKPPVVKPPTKKPPQ